MSAMPYRARPPRQPNVPQTIERAGRERDLASRSVAALVPPYDAVTLLPLSSARTPPLPGTIVVGLARPSIIAAFYELTVAVMEWPWGFPSLVMSATGESADRFPMLIPVLRERLAIARLAPNDARRTVHILD